MPSDLQRVAQGLVECLDEVPQVVQHLQRTAERCRENAALAIAASQGRATVAAQQLDAAARACEEAAHYLSMAPPKAKAWATRLVGGGSSRPDALSADRNRTTGGSGDAAERDLFGRTKRLSLPFKPASPESSEPPIIKVARKALEKLREQQAKDEKSREEADKEREDAFEFEIEVTRDGRAVVVEDQEAPEDRDYDITVDLNAAATELLQAMSATPTHSWQTATITITPDHITASFDYPDLPPSPPPPVIDVELPPPSAVEHAGPAAIEVAAIGVDLPDFDPAFDLRPLGDDFTPAVHDPLQAFSPEERSIAHHLRAQGWRVDARPADHGSAGKNPDATVRTSPSDVGVVVEFKTPTSTTANALKAAMLRARRQADVIVIDGRPTNVAADAADRAYRRCCGQPGVTLPKLIQVILGDGRLVSYPRSADGG
jgi:hypothetical protein